MSILTTGLRGSAARPPWMEQPTAVGRGFKGLILTVVTIGVAQSLAALGFFIPVWLGARAGVSSVATANAEAIFSFTGDDMGLAELVRGFIGAGAPVCGVEEIIETLEELYSRVSSDEVM